MLCPLWRHETPQSATTLVQMVQAQTTISGVADVPVDVDVPINEAAAGNTFEC